MWSRTEHVKLGVALLCACERKGEISFQTSNGWIGYVPQIQCAHSTFAQHIASTLLLSLMRAYFEVSAAVVLFPPPRASTCKQVGYISHFLIACAMSPAEETTAVVVL